MANEAVLKNPLSLFDVKGKVAIVTGASGAFGSLAAKVLAGAGARLVLTAGTKKALEDPAVKKRIEDTGSIIVANTPEQFAAQIKAEYDVYKQVVQKQKLTLD